MAVASVVDRLIDSTSSAKVCGRNALTLFSSPRPRDLRDAVSAAQSSCSTENKRMPARPPYTNRSGSLRIWLNASARSVASMPSTAMMAGMPMARIRMPVATASSADRSVTCISPHCHQVSPPSLPYSSTARAEPGAPMKIGQVDLTTRQGVSPMHHRMMNSSASATVAETQSKLSSIGSEARNAPISRYAGLRAARNGERLDGLGSSTRSLTGLTGMRGSDAPDAVHSPVRSEGVSSTSRAPSAVTSSRSCVTTMMLTPSPRRPWIRRTICIQVRRSWPKVGSSRMSTRGAAARAEATVSRRFSPPESVYGFCWAYWMSRNRVSSSRARRSASASSHPVRRGPSITSSNTLPRANWCSGFWNT